MSQPSRRLRVPPAYAASLSSDPSASDAVSSSVPQYSRSPSPSERVLGGHPVRTFSALSTRELPSKFEFATQHATLDLGERNWHCPLPCYGYGGAIQGVVQVHRIETVSKVELSLVGEVETIVSDTAAPSQSASKRFFKRKITIWDAASSSTSGQQSRHAFTLSFPEQSDIQNSVPLPPSCRLVNSLYSARIQYKVQVDLFRKGLRRHKRVEAEVLYLPKSFAPISRVRPIHVDTKPDTLDLWTRHELLPVQLLGCPTPSSREGTREMVVELFLPAQCIISATSILPYTLRIHSASSAVSGASYDPASLALVQVDVQLVKSTIVMVYGLRKRRDVVLASGVTSSDYQGVTAETDPTSDSAVDGVRVVNGTLEVGGRSGSELSWEFGDFIEVKYCLIVSTKPPSNVRALEGIFPALQATVDVTMKTHTRQEESFSYEDADTDPSVGLFDTAMQEGHVS